MTTGQTSKNQKKKVNSKCGYNRAEDGSHSSGCSRKKTAKKQNEKVTKATDIQGVAKGKEPVVVEGPSASE